MHPSQIPALSVAEFDGPNDDVVLLDVREADEWAAGHVDGAVHIPMFELPNRLADDSQVLDRDRRVVVMCKVGARSAQVTAWLNQQGFDAINLDGGLYAWVNAGRPLIRDGDAPPEVI